MSLGSALIVKRRAMLGPGAAFGPGGLGRDEGGVCQLPDIREPGPGHCDHRCLHQRLPESSRRTLGWPCLHLNQESSLLYFSSCEISNIGQMSFSAQASLITCLRRGLNHRHCFLTILEAGGRDGGAAGLVPPEASPGLADGAFSLHPHRAVPPWVSVSSSPFIRTPGRLTQGPQMTSIYLHHLCKGPISRYSHALESWGSEHQQELGKGSKIQPRTPKQ